MSLITCFDCTICVWSEFERKCDHGRIFTLCTMSVSSRNPCWALYWILGFYFELVGSWYHLPSIEKSFEINFLWYIIVKITEIVTTKPTFYIDFLSLFLILIYTFFFYVYVFLSILPNYFHKSFLLLHLI